MSVATRIYQLTPAAWRSIPATLHGLTLWRWRYGHGSEKLVAEFNRRDRWAPETWASWQQARLRQVLDHAARQVPYYRDYWHLDESKCAAVTEAPWLDLQNWPILRKETLRADMESFRADDTRRHRLRCDSTSGTTGTPLRIWSSRAVARSWFGMFEARVRRWHQVSRHERWAILGGQMVIPAMRRSPPFWVHNYWGHQLYLSAHHVSPANAKHYMAALRGFRPTHMIVYPSSATVLADAILEQHLAPPPLRVIFSNSEALLPRQRQVLADAFQCPVVNTYGSGEMSVGASECEHGQLHLWPDAGIVEVLEDGADKTAAPGKVGRLVVTGLLNEDMPLIRYEIGDRGSMADGCPGCACGRRLPIVTGIEGRTNDLIVTPDGRRVFWLNPVFYGLPVREGQIVQETALALRVKVVAAAGYDAATATEIRQRLAERLGNKMTVCVEQVPEIPRESNGKFRAVVSHVARPEAGQGGGQEEKLAAGGVPAPPGSDK